MFRVALTSSNIAQGLQQRYAPMISVRMMQQLLVAEPPLNWEKMSSAPGLKPAHKQTHLCWARSMVRKEDAFWRKVVFSDESRFILDGTDAYSAHWQDARKWRRWRWSRCVGGGSVIVWGAFSYRGKVEPIFVTVRWTLGVIFLYWTLTWFFSRRRTPKRSSVSTKQFVLSRNWVHERVVSGHGSERDGLAIMLTWSKSDRESEVCNWKRSLQARAVVRRSRLSQGSTNAGMGEHHWNGMQELRQFGVRSFIRSHWLIKWPYFALDCS